MLDLRRNQAKRACILSILLIIAIINISIVNQSTLEQEQTSDIQEFSVPIASDPTAFISVWDTTILRYSSTSSNQICLPLQSSGIYNFTVNWGDGTNETITSYSALHTYTSPGVYTITITGTIVGWQFNDKGDCFKILEIKQWGCLRFIEGMRIFYGCTNLKITATDNLNLTGITSLHRAFAYCSELGNMNNWDVSRVTDMSWMFTGANSFNQPIGNWDVSRVTTMKMMFYYALSFNQYIGDWNVSKVVDMSEMFWGAYDFNQPIGEWDVSSVTDMSSMFLQAKSFNQPIGSWNVSSATNLNDMFENADSFNQPIGDWDVSNVVDMHGMFAAADSFNQAIESWDVSNVKDMSVMFSAASSFNQSLGNWNVSSVKSMSHMFCTASSFDQPLGTWNVSNVEHMESMFSRIMLSTFNYDNLLQGWSHLSLQHGVIFDGGLSKYSSAAAGARQAIITNYGWTITDRGLDISSIPGYDVIVLISVFGLVIILISKKKFANN